MHTEVHSSIRLQRRISNDALRVRIQPASSFSTVLCRRVAGTWLFDRRRWLDGKNLEDLKTLKRVSTLISETRILFAHLKAILSDYFCPIDPVNILICMLRYRLQGLNSMRELFPDIFSCSEERFVQAVTDMKVPRSDPTPPHSYNHTGDLYPFQILPLPTIDHKTRAQRRIVGIPAAASRSSAASLGDSARGARRRSARPAAKGRSDCGPAAAVAPTNFRVRHPAARPLHSPPCVPRPAVLFTASWSRSPPTPPRAGASALNGRGRVAAAATPSPYRMGEAER